MKVIAFSLSLFHPSAKALKEAWKLDAYHSSLSEISVSERNTLPPISWRVRG
jgi:hypothetical protein